LLARKSSAANCVSAVKAPAKKPRPRGLYGTKPIPSYSSVGRMSVSGSRDHTEYSVWTAVTGWDQVSPTDGGGARLGQAEMLDLARLISSPTAPATSSIGTSGATRC
jgi:hypothetical protein